MANSLWLMRFLDQACRCHGKRGWRHCRHALSINFRASPGG